jgi:hypothetical protein
VNVMGDNIETIKSIGTLTDSSMDVYLEIHVEKAKYMFMSHHLNSG